MKVCLANLHEATQQDIFNQVWERAKDKRKAENEDKCLYRAPNGLACFGGCLIADDEYSPIMDAVEKGVAGGSGWGALARNSFVPDYHRTFITTLQCIHDDVDVVFWDKNLREFAYEHDLKVPE